MKKFLGVLCMFLLAMPVQAVHKIEDDILKLGLPESTSNKTIQLGPNFFVRSNESTGIGEFSNDAGQNFLAFGSGGGAGGGQNFNNGFSTSDNPNAELGEDQWTSSGGTFTATDTDPLEGEKSFEYTPAAQNDFVESALLDFDKDILKGRSCQAQVEYIGGDENLTLKVIDGNDLVLGSLVLNAHTIAAPESVFFICPSDTDITGDALKGDIKLRIENTGASASPIIKFDKAYNGTLIGLFETTTPDVFEGAVNFDGTLGNGASDFLESCSITSTGNFSCTYKSGLFSVTPTCQATAFSSSFGRFAHINSLNSTVVNVKTYVHDTDFTTASNQSFFLSCKKQGADAKQSVQVYKSIPKVSENENEFSAVLETSGDSILDQNVPWIASTAGSPAITGTTRINVDTSRFSDIPTCSCVVDNAGSRECNILPVDSDSFDVYLGNSAGSGVNDTFFINCSAKEADYKTPTVQPVIVGQVANSYAENASKNVRVESCRVNNTGTPSTANILCDSWIDSVTLNSTGYVTLSLKSGIFASGGIVCTATARTSLDATVTLGTTSSTTVDVYTKDGLVDENENFYITCQGAI